MTQNAEYADGFRAGYEQAVRDIQRKFHPLWSAVQAAVGASHALDGFISDVRQNELPRRVHGRSEP